MTSKSIRKAQIPVRCQGQDVCPDHRSEIMFYCKDCPGQLVCLQCVTSTHQGHKLENISDIASEKKKNLQDYIKNAQERELPHVKQKIQLIDKQVKENTKYFKTSQDKIKSQGEKLKAEIDRIIQEYITTCRETEERNKDLLSEYKQELQSVYSELSQIINTCEQTIESGNNITVIDVEKDIHMELKVPPAPPLLTSDFTEGHCPTTEFRNGVGSLSVQEEDLGILGMKEYSSNDSTVVHKLKYSTPITSLQKSSSDSVWMSCRFDDFIAHINLQGQVKKKTVSDNHVNDISVSPVTGNLWLCCEDSTVYEMLSGSPTKRFTTDSWPYCLCLTPDDTVVMGTGNHVTVYTTAGHVLHTAKVMKPWHITVYTSTGEIALCDWDSSFSGGQNKPNVSVFNSKLVLKYRYYGPDESEQHMASDFYPIDAVYDSQGHLLIADHNNKCIQLVSSEGQFLTVVYTDAMKPLALALIHDGLFWASFQQNKMKVVQYSV